MKKVDTRDLWLVFSAGLVGMALTFVIVSTSPGYLKAAIVSGGVSLSAVGLAVWRHFRAHEVILLHSDLRLDSEAEGELVFSPTDELLNPKLFLSSHGRPVVVLEIWQGDQPTVTNGPVTISKWRHGVVYEGYLDAGHPLKIQLRNEGFAPAVVHASVAAIKE